MIFYNPGSRLTEKVAFTHNNTNVPEGYITGYYDLVVEGDSSVDVPDTMDMPGVGGGTVGVSLRALQDVIKKQYRERCLIQVDPKRNSDLDDDDNVAPSLNEARVKGAVLYRIYMYNKATEWISIVEENKARGVPSKPATHLFKAALKFMEMDDPANTVETVQRVKSEAASSDAMQAKIDELTRQLAQMQGYQAATGSK